MLHPVLYSKTTDGRLQIWQIEQDGQRYRQISGLLTGRQVVRGWTTAQAKGVGRAATTPEQQADREIAAHYVKKQKQGYSPDQASAGDCAFVEPMLATPLHKVKGFEVSASRPVLAALKLNGERCIATIDGGTSRTGERHSNLNSPHIFAQLAPVFAKYPDLVLDGELFNDTLKDRLAELRKITGTSKPEKITAAFLKRSAEIVQYHVYDGWIADSDSLGPDVAYAQRFPRLVALLAEFSLGEVIQPLIPQKMTSWDDIQNWAAEYIATGGEGLILRVPDMTYEHKRSKNLIKIKEVNDAEFEIVGVAQGTGDWAAALRRFDLCRCASTNDCDISEDVFGADFKDGTIADAQDLWRRRDELIGKIVTVKYNGLTMYNTPNYAKVSFANNINLHKS